MKLYEITNQYEQIFNQVNEDGEISSETLLLLDDLKHDFVEKAVEVAAYVKNIEAEAAAIKEAIANMKAREESLTKKAQALKEYMQFNLQQLGINEIETSPYFKIRLKTCPPSVDVFDEETIPVEYWKEKVVMSLDKIKIKEALSEGVEVPGATIHRNIKLEIK